MQAQKILVNKDPNNKTNLIRFKASYFEPIRGLFFKDVKAFHYNHKIIVFGGLTIDGLFPVRDTVAIYDIKKGEWKTVGVNGEKPSFAFSTATAFEKDGQMMGIIFGGVGNYLHQSYTLNL